MLPSLKFTMFLSFDSFTEAVKSHEMTRNANVVNIDINEGQQLLAQLKDYIERLQEKSQNKHKPGPDAGDNLGFS